MEKINYRLPETAKVLDKQLSSAEYEDIKGTQLALQATGMSVWFGDKVAIQNINFEARSGELTAIVGPNGAGKSTLLKSVLGIVPRVSGSVSFFGKILAAREAFKVVGYVPQRADVDWSFPVNVRDVAMMGLTRSIGWFRKPKAKHRDLCDEALEKVGLLDLADRQIGSLSGGQQQRTLLARSLVQKAKIYLLDEPTAGIDLMSEKTLFGVLRDLANDGCAIVVVHHHLAGVRKYFDRASIINRGMSYSEKASKISETEAFRVAYGIDFDANQVIC